MWKRGLRRLTEWEMSQEEVAAGEEEGRKEWVRAQ
jgi:hypothetical protein